MVGSGRWNVPVIHSVCCGLEIGVLELPVMPSLKLHATFEIPDALKIPGVFEARGVVDTGQVRLIGHDVPW